MQQAIESFVEVDVVEEEFTLVLQVNLIDASAVVDLFHCVPQRSESSLLFVQQFHGPTFQSVLLLPVSHLFINFDKLLLNPRLLCLLHFLPHLPVCSLVFES
ncbi:hypothetical protein DPMN_053017 [Dreissena polymorpha]|uniref:Uncharacterized protein n=1 Tax=Dreissena polymorpha TaxID=45954 RepID=A0A9D4HQC1_DREPO|nr:hypothetical protein DPMN_053017 [Dreissena polymorpha]